MFTLYDNSCRSINQTKTKNSKLEALKLDQEFPLKRLGNHILFIIEQWTKLYMNLFQPYVIRTLSKA